MAEPPRRVAVTRRDFVRAVAAAAVAPASLPAVATRSEGAVARFCRSLTPELAARLVRPFEHPARTRVADHEIVAGPRLADLPAEARALGREIVRDLCTEEGFGRLLRQMAADAGGLDRYHVAVFGKPAGAGPCEWVLTGRHATLRADARRGGASFGGPIFLGHGDPGSGNVWSHLGRQAEAILAVLDRETRSRALVRRGHPPRPPGVAVAELDTPSREQVRRLLADLFGPFRPADPGPLRAWLAGAEALHLTFFEDRDGHAGRVWTLTGPAFAWSYHGSPHVHAWMTLPHLS